MNTFINKLIVPLPLVIGLLLLFFFPPLYANVLNKPTYEVKAWDPIIIPNPNAARAAECAALGVPNGFPHGVLNLTLMTAPVTAEDATAIENVPATSCYAVKIYMFTPIDAPGKARPTVLVLHGGGGLADSGPPNQSAVERAKYFASRGIVVAYLDYQPFIRSASLTPTSEFALPSVRMHGVLDQLLKEVITPTSNIQAGFRFVALTAAQENMLVAYDWLKQNAGTFDIDPNSIGVSGGSYGSFISQANYGLAAYGVQPAGFNFQIASIPCYSLPMRFPTVCTNGPLLTNTPLAGPPLLAFAGTVDVTVPEQFELAFVNQLIAKGIPVEYHRLKTGHQTFDRYFKGSLMDREIQFIYAVSQNEGCVYSHDLKKGKSACHLTGINEIIDGSKLSYDSCFNNRLSFGGHNYALCSGFDQLDQFTLDVADARNLCRAKGGELLKIETVEENNFIKTWAQAQNLNMFSLQGVHFGANDLITEGTWVWNDETTPFWLGLAAPSGGQPVGGLYSNWAGNQPNNSGGNEDCSSMRGFGADLGLWQDGPCTESKSFVCEFE